MCLFLVFLLFGFYAAHHWVQVLVSDESHVVIEQTIVPSRAAIQTTTWTNDTITWKSW